MIDPASPTVIDHRSLVGESPLWDAEAGLIRWCDIDGQAIMAATLDGRLTDVRAFDEPVAAFGQVDAHTLIVAFRDAVDFVDLGSWKRRRLARIPLASSSQRLNDGKVGPDGAFWIGATDPLGALDAKSSLYRVTADGAVERVLSGLAISNGLAWSADGRDLFHADTLPGRIDRWRFEPKTGRISDRASFPPIAREAGLPDGGTCDAEGFYWSAGVTAGCLNRFSPTGALDRVASLPLASPTSICFAGPLLDRAVVTSMVRAGSSHANDGRTLILDLRVSGVPGARFGPTGDTTL